MTEPADQGTIPEKGSEKWWEIAKLVYERAEENAYHDDILMWEVTSITWGANTLLLGFILEALDKPEARPLIIAVSVIGIVLTIFVAYFFHLGKIGQRIAYHICQDIEKKFPNELRLHSQIDEEYYRGIKRRKLFGHLLGRAQKWVVTVTGVFVLGWLFTLKRAVWLQLHDANRASASPKELTLTLSNPEIAQMTIVHSHWWKDPITLFTGIIAIATVAYMFCTILLWISTRKAANAATLSAEAAGRSAEATTVAADAGKKSADAAVEAAEASKKSTYLLAELNRPYMGVSSVDLKPDANAQNAPYWDIAWSIENFGTLTALGVEARLELVIEDKNTGTETPLIGALGPLAAEVFPKLKPTETRTVLRWDEFKTERDGVLNGSKYLIAKIKISYSASDEAKYLHEAEAEFSRGRGTFNVFKSSTKKS